MFNRKRDFIRDLELALKHQKQLSDMHRSNTDRIAKAIRCPNSCCKIVAVDNRGKIDASMMPTGTIDHEATTKSGYPMVVPRPAPCEKCTEMRRRRRENGNSYAGWTANEGAMEDKLRLAHAAGHPNMSDWRPAETPNYLATLADDRLRNIQTMEVEIGSLTRQVKIERETAQELALENVRLQSQNNSLLGQRNRANERASELNEENKKLKARPATCNHEIVVDGAVGGLFISLGEKK